MGTQNEYISSRTNPLIIELAKLSDKKNRDKSRLFAIEGIKLYKEALSKNIIPFCVLATEKNEYLLDLLPENASTRRIVVTESVYNKITGENSPQGIFCAVKYLDNLHNFATIYSDIFSGTLFCLSGVRDPGNVGTIMRSALALGIDTLIMSSDCADIYNQKALRASMGAVFALKTIKVQNLTEAIEAIKNSGYSVYSAALDEGALSLKDLKADKKTCFIVGNEGVGLSNEIIGASSGKVYIPMCEGAESLNVSSAASILMWHVFSAL